MSFATLLKSFFFFLTLKEVKRRPKNFIASTSLGGWKGKGNEKKVGGREIRRGFFALRKAHWNS